jgi:hypothetical protein
MFGFDLDAPIIVVTTTIGPFVVDHAIEDVAFSSAKQAFLPIERDFSSVPNDLANFDFLECIFIKWKMIMHIMMNLYHL